jgi:TRAP-type C4-dicarboxylate transport system substrate-binding protein
MKRSKIKLSLIGLMVLMLLVMTACGSSDTSSSSEGSTSGEGSKSAKPIEFSMGHMNSTEHVQHTMAMVPFGEEVAKVTEGRVNFKIYPGGALAAPKESYDSIVTGIQDAGWGLQGYTAGKFPLHSVIHLPFMADGTGAELSVVAQKLYDQFPEIQKEYGDVKPLWLHTADPYAIVTKGKAVKSFEDVKGLKLRAPSVEASAMIESWGATPVSFPAPEIFDSLQKGVIDGAVLPVSAIKDFNLFEVVDYVTLGNFNTSLFFVVMNKSSYDKISEEDKTKFDALIGVPMAKQAGEAFDHQAKLSEEESKKAGIEFITLPDAELQKFRDASQVVTDNWKKEMEAKGFPAQQIYDEAVKLIQGN